MQLFAEGKCGPVNRRETCQEEVWGGLSFDMYNVFTNVMHGDFRLAAALDSGRGKKTTKKKQKKFREAATLSGLGRQNMAHKTAVVKLVDSLQGHNVRRRAAVYEQNGSSKLLDINPLIFTRRLTSSLQLFLRLRKHKFN